MILTHLVQLKFFHGAGAGVTPTVETPVRGGGAYKRYTRKGKWWEDFQKEEVLEAATAPVRTQAKRLFRQKLEALELPDVESFIKAQEAITRQKMLAQEEMELRELLQII